MKPKEMMNIIDKDIEVLEKQIEFLQGQSLEDPDVSIEDLSSMEFVEELKKASNDLDKKLNDHCVADADFYEWVERELKVKPMVEIDDQMYWTPAVVANADKF